MTLRDLCYSFYCEQNRIPSLRWPTIITTITAKLKTSRQKQKPRGKTKYFIAKTKYLTKKANTHGKTKAILLLP